MRTIRSLYATNPAVVASTPGPYFTLRRKLMGDASSKYLAGQEISPILKPNITACAIIWLSKTKSSEFSSSGSVSSSFHENARKPVWYSNSFTIRNRFWKAVSSRFATYL